ncbi:MAG: hypothetical protein R2762_07000 [Bryobacteraceae bacterium]
MQGILVHGSNHFIVNGPCPADADALALARRWEIPEIGRPAGAPWREWSLCTKAFREDLAWAVVLASESAVSAAVSTLLAELASRGVAIRHAPGPWKAEF